MYEKAAPYFELFQILLFEAFKCFCKVFERGLVGELLIRNKKYTLYVGSQVIKVRFVNSSIKNKAKFLYFYFHQITSFRNVE